MIAIGSDLLAGIAARAALAAERKRHLLNQPQLPVRASPLCARRAEASDDHPPVRSSSDPRGSAVEAGRPANPSTSDECDCAVCSSDLAGIVPCEREESL
ncbi:hypothetical protein [Sphingobium sp. CFD-2]|uniref:hypothetical protein n=1 Tax=Sphingobium sp. CFD-2 TaxID=2878542 RepID=UPI00214CCDB9|nr:hypothetical protein [Sphingobium sp. CFD-2]